MRPNAEARRCDLCGGWTYRTRCPVCPGQPALETLDRIAEEVASGKRPPPSWDEVERMMFRKAAG